MAYFKNMVKSIADKAETNFSPLRRPSSTGSSNDGAEGFICPGCMASFASPDDLQVHHAKEHANGDISSDVKELQATLKEEQSFSAQLQKEVDRLTAAMQKSSNGVDGRNEVEEMYLAQVTALEEAKDLLTREVIELRDKLDTSEEDGRRMRQKADELSAKNAELSEVVDASRAIRERLDLAEKMLEQRNDNDDVAAMRKELHKVHEIMVEDVNEGQSENAVLRAEISHLTNRLEDVRSHEATELDAKIEDLTRKLGQVTSQCSELSAANVQLNQQLTAVGQRETDVRNEMQELCSKHKTEAEELAHQNETLRQSIRKEMDDRVANANSTEKEIEILRRDLHLEAERFEVLQKQHSQLAAKENQTLSQLKDLREREERSKSDATNLQSTISSLELQLEKSNNSLAAKEATLADLNRQLEASANSAEKTKKEYEKNMSARKSDLDKSAEKLAKLGETNALLLSTNDDLESQLKAEKRQCGRLSEEIKQNVELYEKCKKSESQLEEKCNRLQSQIKVLSDREVQLESKMKNLASTVDSLKSDGEKSRTDLAAKDDLLRSLGGQLEASAKSVEAIRQESEKKVSLTKSQLAESNEKLVQLEKAQSDLSRTKDDLESRLEAVEAERDRLSESKRELESAISEHSDEILAGKEKLDAIRTDLVAAEARADDATVNLDAALSDRLELEAKVEAASDERKSLLERCLGAESDLDRSRTTIVELRRKLDDSQAALHELGRENQSIQVELAKQTGRKWADDSETTTCVSCQSAFSITNRKHHCRNCGQIFCADCSSKQANMANFKKPQRVCDTCHAEIAQSK